jgi:diacylglycerol kinase (ATP)
VAAPADDLFVVFNPRSGKGRGARLVAPVLQALGGDVAHGLTVAAGDEVGLTTEALGRGFRRIVAVGGDGTWGNVGNAIIRSGVDAALGLVPAGTGCDLAKSLGVPGRDVPRCAQIARDGHSRRIDAGRIEGRYFLNVAGFGFDIAVIEDSWKVRFLGGDLLYLFCALRQLHRFPGFPVSMAVDGEAPQRREMLMLVVANARIFGGGFKIAPEADLCDGRVDIVSFANMPLLRRLSIMGRLLRGTHGGAPEVASRRGRRLDLRFDTPPAYETDGEWHRAASADLTIEAVPSALRVLVPREA